MTEETSLRCRKPLPGSYRVCNPPHSCKRLSTRYQRKLNMKFFCCLLISFSLATTASAQVEDFDSIKLFTLINENGMTVKVTNYGAIITSIVVPDREGKMADVALGYNRVEDYINAVDKPYFGAVVGRYGNRIANGEFTLNGETYSLLKNNGSCDGFVLSFP